jgi:hypothetical protein
MWENLRLFSVLIPAVISVYALFLRLIYEPSMGEYTSVLLGVSWAFPIVVIILSGCDILDLYGRWNRTLEAIAHLSKLEKLLGQDDQLPQDKRVFKDDTHLFQRYQDKTIGINTEEQFIKKNIIKFNCIQVSC